MANMSRRTTSEVNLTVVGDDNERYEITQATIDAAPERARTYMEAVLKWRKEFDTHLVPIINTNDYDTQFKVRFSNVLADARLPKGVWFPTEEGFTRGHMAHLLRRVASWAEGDLEAFEVLYDDLDEEFDLDHTYIFFGVPIHQISVETQHELRRLGREIGGAVAPVRRRGGYDD